MRIFSSMLAKPRKTEIPTNPKTSVASQTSATPDQVQFSGKRQRPDDDQLPPDSPPPKRPKIN